MLTTVEGPLRVLLARLLGLKRDQAKERATELLEAGMSEKQIADAELRAIEIPTGLLWGPGVRAGQLYAYRAEGPWDPANGLRFDPGKVLEALESERITMLFGVPTMFQFLLRQPDATRRDLSAWRTGLFGAVWAQAELRKVLRTAGLLASERRGSWVSSAAVAISGRSAAITTAILIGDRHQVDVRCARLVFLGRVLPMRPVLAL